MRAEEHFCIALQFHQNRHCAPALIRLLRFAPQPPFPQGKAWGFPQIQGFPYEGKLSAVRLTDEVDSVT